MPSQGQKRYPKELLRQRFAELSGELSGAICLKALVLLGSDLELFRKFFRAVRATFWLWVSFLAPDLPQSSSNEAQPALAYGGGGALEVGSWKVLRILA